MMRSDPRIFEVDQVDMQTAMALDQKEETSVFWFLGPKHWYQV